MMLWINDVGKGFAAPEAKRNISIDLSGPEFHSEG